MVRSLLTVMPTKGKFTQTQFLILQASLGLLSNEDLLKEVAVGNLTLNAYLQSFPSMIGLQLPQPGQLLAPEPAFNSVSEAEAEGADEEAGEASSEAVAQNAVETSHEAEAAPSVEDEDSKTVSAPAATVEESAPVVEPEPAPAGPAASESDEGFALLGDLFGEETAQELVSATPASEAPDSVPEEAPKEEVANDDSDIPPAPTEFFISDF